MLDGTTVRLDDGALAQVKRLPLAGSPWQTVQVAVAVPPPQPPRPSLPESPVVR